MIKNMDQKFGVLKLDIPDSNGNKSQYLKRGSFIRIIRVFSMDQCLFTLWETTDLVNKDKPVIHKCGNDDYIEVNNELWPYIMPATNYEERVKLVQCVQNGQFDINLLKLGCVIKIQRPHQSNDKYYEFVVVYNGVMKEIGVGFHIALQLKNESQLPHHMKNCSRYYDFEGIGIVVTINWIIKNLYKEDNILPVLKSNPTQSNPSVLNMSVEQIYSNLNIPSTSKQIDASKSISNADDRSKSHTRQSAFLSDRGNQSSNTIASDVLKKTSGSVRNTEETKCDLCDAIIKINSGIILRECIHSFCLKCMREYINRHSNYSTIQCPYNNDYKCEINLLDVEIKDVCEQSIYKKILKNRLKEYQSQNISDTTQHVPDNKQQKKSSEQKIVTNNSKSLAANCYSNQINNRPKVTADEMLKLILDNDTKTINYDILDTCGCRSAFSGCIIVLKCKHQFCKTLLLGIFKKQLQCVSRIACPICCEKIDDFLQNYIVDRIKLNNVVQCRTCLNSADMHLTTCQHSFCYKCVHESIMNQVIDSSKITINCSVCNDLIIDSDMLRYGSEELFAIFKSKIEAATTVANPINRITFNSWPFECNSCGNSISIKGGVRLAECRDLYCLACCKQFIERQIANSEKPHCPCCKQLMKEFEVEAFVGKTNEACNNSSTLVECLKCEDKFEEGFIQKCTKCCNSICFTCAKSTIMDQIANNRSPTCPFCQILLGESQIFIATNNKFQIPQQLNIDHNPVNILFECVVCEQSPNRDEQIVLTNCKHEICRKCLTDSISTQMSCDLKPKCPFCGLSITELQLNALGFSITSKHVQTKNTDITQNSDEVKTSSIKTKAMENSKSKKSGDRLVNSQTNDLSVNSNAHKQELSAMSKISEKKNNFKTSSSKNNIAEHVHIQNTKITEKVDEAVISSIDTKLVEPDKLETPATRLVNCHVNKNILNLEKSSNKKNVAETQSNQINVLGKSNLSNDQLECVVCEKSVDRDSQMVLTNCKHEICRKCLADNNSTQMSCDLKPKCPVCGLNITELELEALGLLITRQHLQTTNIEISKNRDEAKTPSNKMKATEISKPGKSGDRLINSKTNNFIGNSSKQALPLNTFISEKKDNVESKTDIVDHFPMQNTNITEKVDGLKSSINTKVTVKAKAETSTGRFVNHHTNELFGNSYISKQTAPSASTNISGNKYYSKPDIENKLGEPNLADDLFECIVCEQSADRDSQIVLINCNHEICRKCLLKKLSTQMQYDLKPKCPFCDVHIGSIQLDLLGLSSESKQYRMQSIKRKNTGEVQISKLKTKEINLLARPDPNNDQQISNTEIHATSRSLAISEKINETPMSSNQVLHLKQEAIDGALANPNTVDVPFECLACEQTVDHESQIVLLNCEHAICRKCLVTNISSQMEWTQLPKCPICMRNINQLQLKKLEISIATTKTTDETIPSSNISNMTGKCSVCYEKYKDKVILKNCSHEFCRQCVLMSVTAQLNKSNETAPSCPMCRKSIERDELTKLRNVLVPEVDAVQLNNELYPKIRLNYVSFICPICKKCIERECGITLANCGESLCWDCVSHDIMKQSAYQLVPNCPMCRIQMKDEEVQAIDSGAYELFVQNRKDQPLPVQQSRQKIDGKKMDICYICKTTLERYTTKTMKLLFCDDYFCRSCITTELNNQLLVNTVPSCPVCIREVAASDIISLCGSEGFKQYMTNKRDK